MYKTPLRHEAFTRYFSMTWKRIALAVLGLALVLVCVTVAMSPHPWAIRAASTSGAGDWSTYMYTIGRSGYNQAETIINQASAPNLKVHWSVKAGGAVFSQPVVANGIVYWGSFDGYEHATDLNGQQVWPPQYLGKITTCDPVSPNPLGVVSSAAVVNGVVYVGGGDHNLYALKATSGQVLWRTLLPPGSAGTNTFIWDSPLVLNNNVYIGTATTGESVGCKVVPGQLFELNASNGSIEHTFNTVPAGCTGAGIWSSPVFDAFDGSIYFTTGTQGHCSEPNAIGLVKLRATDLTLLSSWSIPLNQRLSRDSDFAGTPTLFTASIPGTSGHLVGAVDKNGIYYVFDRTSLSKGPIWQRQIATGGACPQCGQGSISSAVTDNNRIYVAGGITNSLPGGQTCKGSLQALNPADSNPVWQDCLPGTVIGAVTLVPGVVAVVDGGALTLVNATSGTTLFTSTAAHFYGSPSISNGVLYVGTKSGLYSFWTQ